MDSQQTTGVMCYEPHKAHPTEWYSVPNCAYAQCVSSSRCQPASYDQFVQACLASSGRPQFGEGSVKDNNYYFVCR